MKMKTNNEMETRKLGAKLWGDYKDVLKEKALVFALEGELGAGKTQLVKGLAKGMGVKDLVISPTFTLEAEYDLGKLIHIDAWRIEEPKELLEIGFEKRVKEKQLIVIEWADQVREILDIYSKKAKIVWVGLKYGEGENERVIEIKEK